MRDRLSALKGVESERKRQLQQIEQALEEAQAAQDQTNQAILLAEGVLAVTGRARNNLAALAGMALRAGKGEDYGFEFEEKDKGLLPLITERGKRLAPKEFGGAARSLCASGLRISTLLLWAGELSPVLLLDEPNRNCRPQTYRQWHTWLSTLCSKTSLQGIIVAPHVDLSDHDLPNTSVVRVWREGTWSMCDVLTSPGS